MLLGGGLGLVEALVVRGNHYDWVLKAAFIMLATYLGGVLRLRLGSRAKRRRKKRGLERVPEAPDLRQRPLDLNEPFFLGLDQF